MDILNYTVISYSEDIIDKRRANTGVIMGGVSVRTGTNGTVVMSSANVLVGAGFASRYRLQPRAGF